MRNKYRGNCYRCGAIVEAGQGHFERDRQLKTWLVQHADCAIKYRGTDFTVLQHKRDSLRFRPKTK